MKPLRDYSPVKTLGGPHDGAVSLEYLGLTKRVDQQQDCSFSEKIKVPNSKASFIPTPKHHVSSKWRLRAMYSRRTEPQSKVVIRLVKMRLITHWQTTWGMEVVHLEQRQPALSKVFPTRRWNNWKKSQKSSITNIRNVLSRTEKQSTPVDVICNSQVDNVHRAYFQNLRMESGC